tara:strand:+ start:78 stop:410 length:333 start_codon:yes stop_codon:yes gene_type:complete
LSIFSHTSLAKISFDGNDSESTPLFDSKKLPHSTLLNDSSISRGPQKFGPFNSLRISSLQSVSPNKEIVGIFKENPMFIGPESGVPKTFALLIRLQFSIRERLVAAMTHS